MHNILVFGSGAVADILVKYYFDFNNVNILAFVNNTDISEKEKYNKKIIPVDEIPKYEYDYIVIAAGAYDAIYRECVNAGIPKQKIVGVLVNTSAAYENIVVEINKQINDTFNFEPLKQIFKSSIAQTDASSFFIANEILHEPSIDMRDYSRDVDIQRLRCLQFLARELIKHNVGGAVAELGVYKGDFARALNAVFPDRTLYLFDSFEGFTNVDLKAEEALNETRPSIFFRDTSVELVLEKMPNRQNCRVIKGWFPESTKGIEETTFAFVSIDADLFLPIYEGLKYFYQRLERNGYILVHDFNNAYFPGAREAVEKFCHEQQIGYTPIADSHGSAVLTK